MRYVSFEPRAFEDYVEWASADKKVFQKINALLKEIQREPFKGTGKPEPLKGSLAGFWSRRITDEHRLVYKAGDDEVVIIGCRGHYH